MMRKDPTRLLSVIAGLVLAVVLTSTATARGADVPPKVKLRFGVVPVRRPSRKHFQDAVQKTPDFVLIDGKHQIRPSRPGLVYHIERAEGNRILLSIANRGLYGWAPRDSVIPYIEAEGYFTNELETQPPTAFGYLMRAIVCEDNDRTEHAFRDLAEALRLNPRYTPALIERSFLWALRSQMDRAVDDVNRALTIDPNATDALVERGVYRFQLHQHQAALADLDRAWALGARVIYIPMVRGSILVEQQQLDEAVKAFQQALTIDPKHYDAHLMLGSTYLLASRPHRAIKSFAEAIKLESERGSGYGGRAVAYMSLGRRHEALNDLNQAIRYEPNRGDLFRDRGQAYAMEGDWRQALTDMDTAVGLAPDDVEAHVARAWTLATCPDAKLRNGASAVASATRACELSHWKEPRPLSTLAAAFAESGNYEGAVKMQQRAIEATPPKDPVVDYYRACLDRYRSGKPWHRLSVLEEIGLRKYHSGNAPAKQDSDVQKTGGR